MFYQGSGDLTKVGFVMSDPLSFQNCITPDVSEEATYYSEISESGLYSAFYSITIGPYSSFTSQVFSLSDFDHQDLDDSTFYTSSDCTAFKTPITLTEPSTTELSMNYLN